MNLAQQFGRFAIVGVINTAVGLGTIYGLMAAGIGAISANATGFSVGIIVSLLLNRRWTFAAQIDLNLVWRYAIAVAISYTVNLVVLVVLTAGFRLDPYIAQIPAMAIYSVSFFLLCKTFVFQQTDDFITTLATLWRFEVLAGVIVIIPSLLYLSYKALFDFSDPADFKYIWLAGHLWATGENPYGPSYGYQGEQIFSGTNIPAWWVYPPNWWPVARMVALQPYEQAASLWRLCGGALLGLGALAVTISTIRKLGEMHVYRVAAFIILVASSTSTAVSLSLGQTSPLLFLGCSLFVSAWLFRSKLIMIVAIVLIAMKPNVCIALCALLLANRYWWSSLISAGLLTLTFAIPSFVSHGFSEVLNQYLGLVGRYSEAPENMAHSTTGLRTLLYEFGFGEASPILLTLIGAAIIWLVGLHANRLSTPEGDAVSLCLSISLVALFVPLHTYDMLLLFPLVLLCVKQPIWLQVVVGFSMLIVFREANLALATGIFNEQAKYFPGTLLISLAVAAMTLSFVLRRIQQTLKKRGVQTEASMPV